MFCYFPNLKIEIRICLLLLFYWATGLFIGARETHLLSERGEAEWMSLGDVNRPSQRRWNEDETRKLTPSPSTEQRQQLDLQTSIHESDDRVARWSVRARASNREIQEGRPSPAGQQARSYTAGHNFLSFPSVLYSYLLHGWVGPESE